MVGEHDEAIRQHELLFSLPGGPSVLLLRLEPVWRPLSDHPRFPDLLRTYDSFPSSSPRSP